MSRDGSHVLFLIQHRYEGKDWVQSDVEHFLFRDLSFDDRRGRVGDRRSALLNPQHLCWRSTGVHGFLVESEARAVLDLLRRLLPPQGGRVLPEFRLVRRTIEQRTEPLGEKIR